MPNAIAEAHRLYGSAFASLHGLYSQYGYVYSEPEALLLFRPCVSRHHETWVGKEEADAWWVQLAIGEGALANLYSHAPFRLPLVGWERAFNNRPHVRFYSFDRLGALLKWAQ